MSRARRKVVTQHGNSIGIGVIGTGGMGSRHARNIHRRVVGGHVAGVFDVDERRAAAVAAECGNARVFGQPEALINDDRIDAVIVASPNQTHADYTLACLQTGTPVLCEKPLATDANDARTVIDAEVALGERLVTVGFMRRFDPYHVAAKQAVQSGAIGRPYLYKGVHRNESIPPDFPREFVISQSAIHDIDATRWFLEQEIAEVYVRGVRVDSAITTDTLDLVVLTMTLQQGGLSTIELFLSAHYGYEVTAEIVGERGTVLTEQPDAVMVRASGARSVSVPEDWLQRFERAYVVEVQEWVSHLHDDTAHVGADAWDGYVSILASDACIASMTSGRPEPVPLPDVPALYA